MLHNYVVRKTFTETNVISVGFDHCERMLHDSYNIGFIHDVVDGAEASAFVEFNSQVYSGFDVHPVKTAVSG